MQRFKQTILRTDNPKVCNQPEAKLPLCGLWEAAGVQGENPHNISTCILQSRKTSYCIIRPHPIYRTHVTVSERPSDSPSLLSSSVFDVQAQRDVVLYRGRPEMEGVNVLEAEQWRCGVTVIIDSKHLEKVRK